MEILSNVPAIILLVVVVAFLGYTGFRLGLPFLVRRIAGLVFVLLSVSIMTFLLGKAAPTNGIDGQLAETWIPTRTAKAKGLSNRAVVWRHTFRNAMIPLITVIGPALALIVNGAFITEALFNIPGIGFTALSAISNNDFPILEGTVILLATSVVFMNLVSDVLYGVVDPCIKSA
jgi:ABC-type dipeptide/oligopeptide/nickel transport system permease component